MMKFVEGERPYIVQIFGSSPETMAKAAKIIAKHVKPDGIDINFGCPVQKAAKQQFGSYQLRDPQKAAAIVRAVTNATKLPVSVKMRLPSKIEGEIVEFVKLMFKSGAKLISIHARTATQKYGGHADWELLHKIKNHFPDKFILGSGDICSFQDLKDKLGNLDGALVGRAAKRDPEIFKELKLIKTR
jgi:tRNA-dihydrouridine synthase B